MAEYKDFDHFITVYEDNIIEGVSGATFDAEDFNELFISTSIKLPQLHTFYKTFQHEIVKIINKESPRLQVFHVFKLYINFLEKELDLSTPVATRPIIAKTNPSLVYKLSDEVAAIKAPDANILSSPKQSELREKMRAGSQSDVVSPPSLSAEGTKNLSISQPVGKHMGHMKSLIDDELHAILARRKRTVEE